MWHCCGEFGPWDWSCQGRFFVWRGKVVRGFVPYKSWIRTPEVTFLVEIGFMEFGPLKRHFRYKIGISVFKECRMEFKEFQECGNIAGHSTCLTIVHCPLIGWHHTMGRTNEMHPCVLLWHVLASHWLISWCVGRLYCVCGLRNVWLVCWWCGTCVLMFM